MALDNIMLSEISQRHILCDITDVWNPEKLNLYKQSRMVGPQAERWGKRGVVDERINFSYEMSLGI